MCWAAPYSHFVWYDDNNAYDNLGEADEFIPEEYLGDMIKYFLHIPEVEYNASEKEINECIERYRKDKDEKNN